MIGVLLKGDTMIYDFIPKNLFPYIKTIYDDHLEIKDNIPLKYKKKINHINKHYNTYINYYTLHQLSGFWRPKKTRIKNRLFGENYNGVPSQLYNYLDFNNYTILQNKIIMNKDLHQYYCYYFKIDMEYYKLKNYIIKTPKNPKITLKEHIQMLFGRRCIKFEIY